MFPASFRRTPVLRVREQRSEPARSHRASLNTHEWVRTRRGQRRSYKGRDSLADGEHFGNADMVDAEDPDGEDAVAAETQSTSC